jgi:hypothetical protein
MSMKKNRILEKKILFVLIRKRKLGSFLFCLKQQVDLIYIYIFIGLQEGNILFKKN